MLIPNLTIFTTMISFPLIAILFTGLMALFYQTYTIRKPWCALCETISCININDWCRNSAST